MCTNTEMFHPVDVAVEKNPVLSLLVATLSQGVPFLPFIPYTPSLPHILYERRWRKAV